MGALLLDLLGTLIVLGYGGAFLFMGAWIVYDEFKLRRMRADSGVRLPLDRTTICIGCVVVAGAGAVTASALVNIWGA